MSILLNGDLKVLVHGGTGAYGRAQLDGMRKAGTRLVAMVSLGRGGGEVEGLPVFDTVADAVAATGADTAVVYTPAPGVKDAVIELADGGIGLAMVAAEGVPVHDALICLAHARERGLWVVGPNCAGIVSPGKELLGSIGVEFTMPGEIGLIGRSGALTITTTRLLTQAGFGQSTSAHMGGDSVVGRNPDEYLRLFLDDPETRAVIYLGEIGGSKEYGMLEVISTATKPVVALVAGRYAPPGKRMGHAGALVGGDRETAKAKREALREAGALIADNPPDIPRILREHLSPDAGRAGHG